VFPWTGFASYEISDGSIKALYHLDGDSVDATGNGLNGTDYSISYITGKVGQAATTTSLVSGVDGCGRIVIDDDDLFDVTTNDFSIGGWFKFNELATTYSYLFTKSNGNGFNEWEMLAPNSSDVARFVTFGATTAPPTLDGSEQIDNNAWRFIVMYRDGSERYIYLDGNFHVSSTNATVANVDNTNKVVIGGYDSGGLTYALCGAMDEVFFMNRVITPTEITALYNSGNGEAICTSVGCDDSAPSSTTSSSTLVDIVNYADFFIDFLAFAFLLVMILFKL